MLKLVDDNKTLCIECASWRGGVSVSLKGGILILNWFIIFNWYIFAHMSKKVAKKPKAEKENPMR